MEGVAELSIHVQSGISVLSVFAECSLVVKLVMLVLATFSSVSWAVIFKKSWVFNKFHREIRDLEVLLSVQGMASNVREIVECGSGVVSQVLQHGIKNARLVSNKKDGFNKFASAELNRTVGKLETQLEILSIIGSSSVFIGVFGAIWSMVENLKLLVASGGSVDMLLLAPWIAEVLYTIAFGLAVSIPASVFCKRFVASAERISNRLNSLIYELGVFVVNDE